MARILAIAILSLTIASPALAKADSGIVKGPGLAFGSIAKKAPKCRIVETRNAKGKLEFKKVCTKR
jgi:hypothetical protein